MGVGNCNFNEVLSVVLFEEVTFKQGLEGSVARWLPREEHSSPREKLMLKPKCETKAAREE